MRHFRLLVAVLLSIAATVATASAAAPSSISVTRATLSNGLRVVVVHDPLAPVVTAMLNYEAGSDQQTVAGEAHALEHMMFRGSATVSSSQLMDSLSLTGGDFDADTQDAVTQYYFTMPSQYLDVALNLERSRATGLSLAPDQWAQERGAITQEVTQDNSNAITRLFKKVSDRMLAGTPYAKNGLGTVYDFAHKVNTPLLRKFYGTWYHPNNAVYVIVGDVDGPATVAKVKQLFGNWKPAKLPAQPKVVLKPITGKVYHDTSDLPFTLIFLGYRMPGYFSHDYAAAQILSDVLSSPRGNLFALAAEGKALQTGFQMQSFQKTALGLAIGVVPVSVKPQTIDREIRTVIDGYRKTGVPADLVEAAKQREIAQLQFNANSIENLAFQWSQAVAVQHLSSPDDMVQAYEHVTTADVNRVLRKYVNNSNVVAAYAVPKNNGKVNMGGGPQAKENNMVPPKHHEPLPAFAQNILKNLKVPAKTLAPTETTLPNGLHLIVQPEKISKTVEVSGRILLNPFVEEPANLRGINDLTSALFPYGTTTYSRIAYQAQLDKIAATVNAGADFSLQVLSKNFDRGMQLLADDELHPAFNASDFAIVSRQQVGAMAGTVNSPDYLTEIALNKALYPAGDPYQNFANVKTVSSITLADVKSFYAKAYRPDLTTIVVIGDVTPAQAQAVVAKYFGSWQNVGPTPDVYPPAVSANKPGAIDVPATGRVQSSVQLVELNSLRRSDPDWAALQLANAALSGGFYSSILYHDLREVHGYAYAVGSRFNVGKSRSTFTVTYACDPQNIVPAQNAVVGDLQRLQTVPLSQNALDRSKAMLLGDVPIQQSSYGGVAALFLSYAGVGLPLDQYQIDAQHYLGTSAAQVQAAFAKYVRPTDFVRVVTGPAPK